MNITTYIRAGFSCLYAVSFEEDRVTSELAEMAKKLGYKFWVWDCAKGLHNETSAVDKTDDPLKALACIREHEEKPGEPKGKTIKNKSIVVLKDFHLYLAKPTGILIRLLKECIASGRATNRHIIILGCVLNLPPELMKEITVIEYSLPDKEQLKVVAEQIAASSKQKLDGKTDAILDSMSGLTTVEAADAAAFSVVEKGEIDPAVVQRIKVDTIKKNGILELVNVDIDLNRIGGLQVIKTWLKKRKAAFTKEAKEYGLPTPKGLLLLGVAGTGKTLIAKATARVLGVPLLKLDGGKIFGSLVGASEQNMRTALQTAEAIAPSVLFIDELEKAMSGSGSSNHSDGGTSARVLGTFLQWMQEKTTSVFVVATANDVSQLPPELLRRGRFDQMFFVDLPNASERHDIWCIHIERLGRKPKSFNIGNLAELTDGFTGAEIESIVVEGLFSAFDEGCEPTNAIFEAAIHNTVPLSKTMAEQIRAMREWADGRAIRASEKVVKEVAAPLRKIG